ncbi:peroxiredoxin [Lactococcus piscium]|uniref:alkyl hydroperoxide reductase subunit C n=1 Tax=Pseudolactococcus carnosus TaxID=2749961 RepID=UPI0015DCFE5E|nr:alkyl hydroperoxide reductase subunit C [Lactococcus carnosus]MCJ1972449.1 peroxiredoxin [Lactococcus carnosus]MCJ1975706.1 peroxiredoxin [Lactococcus carnosus]MCJ1985951.1 peroxiredoxin [Lactococcus carnosus]MCJ1987097.1 peroxiredoxin [Lactococcus carnosus]MCJ2004200.1 peroxiredoxin [Lactococcus carnosus]
MSLIGKEIDNFVADAYQEGKFLTVNSEDFKGKWQVIVFYPADFSFVCPTELEDLQEQYDFLQSLGVDVYSCSTDTHFVHAAWHEHSEAIGKVTYPMLADPTQKISRIFDVLDEASGLSQRGSFIIDPDGVVQAVEITADGIGRDASQLVDKVRAAQYVRKNPGEVCPAKWKEDAETLTPGLDLVGKI